MSQTMSNVLGLAWAPHTVAVELVLNGEYLGSYFLSETIKIDNGRLNFYEQNDGETNPDILLYGWLIEIDNYPEDNQVAFWESEYDNLWIRFKPQSPEELSEPQRQWLESELRKINDLIYNSTKDNPAWAEYIDVESAAKFFIIQEVLHDLDGYNGSFYLYKDSAENAKWHFGPVWDAMANTYEKDCFVANDSIIQSGNTYSAHWIRKLMWYPYFQDAVRTEWAKFYTDANLDSIENTLLAFAEPLSPAFAANVKRWGDILPFEQLHDQYWHPKYCRMALRNNSAWINSHLNNEDFTATVEMVVKDAAHDFFSVNGNVLTFSSEGLQPGSIFIADATGRIVARPAKEYDSSALPHGLYVVCARSADGEFVSRKLMR